MCVKHNKSLSMDAQARRRFMPLELQIHSIVYQIKRARERERAELEEPFNPVNKVHVRQTSCMKNEYEGVCVIENFRKLESPAGQFVQCSNFFTGKDDECEWAINVYPNGYDDEHSKYIAIRFDLFNEYVENLCDVVGSHFTASIIDKDGKKYSTKSAVTEKHYNKYFAIIKDFLRRDDLWVKESKLLTRGDMKIAFKVSFNSLDTSEQTRRINQSTTLDKVFDAGKYTDFKLIVGKKEFNVHRAILAAQSPVFEAMFDTNMRENKEGKVKILHIEAKVIEKLLNFVYVGKMENFEEFADQIFVAADKYQIDELKYLCENILVKQLSVDNVYDNLRLAEKYNAENLKKKTIQFFRCNAEKLSAQRNFKDHLNLLSKDLMADLICALSHKS